MARHFRLPTKQDVIDELKNQEMLWSSFKYYQYSNLGLSLLGFIVEEVTQTNFDDYVNQNILIPLSMNRIFLRYICQLRIMKKFDIRISFTK